MPATDSRRRLQEKRHFTALTLD
ncbi:hypothetical protein PXNS11_250038 [Stutzerimonas xanthomarina]|nr:hypothetical protein PXNS11_250038 [Stutzerimonas xanthomarina]